MSNTKSIANNNSDLVQGPCPINQSEDFYMAIDKDELIAMVKKSIESAEFDFDKNPISDTCRFLSLKNIVVAEQSDRYNDSKEIADIVEKVFDDYLANEISKMDKTLLEKKVVKKKVFGKPILSKEPREDAIAAVKKIASGYIYSTEWAKNGDPSVEYEKLQHLESQARDEVIRLYGLDDELIDTVSSEFKEFYKHHPTIFFPTKPSERTCENEDIVSVVKSLAAERLEFFKFQANEDPEDAYIRFKAIESQVKDDVTSIYGQRTELLDAVSRVFNEFYEVYRYFFFTGNKEPQEITDPVCASEDTDEKEEATELACSTEDTDAKPEESPEEELTEITDALTPDKKTAKVTEIADECVKNIRFDPGEGKLVDLLRVVDAERKAASMVYELYGENRYAIEELSKYFKRCYEEVEQFYSEYFKKEALVMPEPADMPKILDGIYGSINRIVMECMSGTELEYNDGSDYDLSLIKKVSHDIKSKVTEMFGDNKAIQNFANDMFRDRLAGAPKVENATVQSESLGKENCSMVKHVVITDEEKVAVANKIANDCVGKIKFCHDEGEAIELLRMFEAEREATSKVVDVYGDDKVALNAIHEIFNCLYENIKQFYEGEPKEEKVLVEKESTHITDAPDGNTHEKKVDECKFDKQLVKSMTEDVFGIGNEDAINAVLNIFDKQYSCYTGEVKVEKLIKKAILSYIAKEAVDYSGLSLSENKSDEQMHIFEARKEAIDKAKEIYGDDKDLLDYVENEVGLYATAIAATLQLPNMEEKKQNRPMPIITKPIGRRIPGMSHVVQKKPLTVFSQNSQTTEPGDLPTGEESNVSGKEIENLITKIYGERSRKNLPKESQEQCEQKDEAPSKEKLHIGLARRIALSADGVYNSPLYGITRKLLDEQYPNEEYLRPYKYGLVAPFGRREERFETERELQDIACFVWPFNSLLRYRDNWLCNYYGYGARYDSDLKFSIHRVRMDKDKYDYVVIENSHSTRPLSFPTKDMADNFLIVFRDLIEASGNLI